MLNIVSDILNNALYVSILVILVSSLVSFYVQSRARDRCLRDLDGYKVTVEDKTGDVMWGVLRAYSSGLELLYTSTHHDTQGHVENSYIMYESDLGNLQAIYRIHDDQSERQQQKRKRDIQRTYYPTLYRRAARAVRNAFSTFRDAIVQAINAVLGYRATQSPQNVVLSKHKELTASGVQLIGGAVGHAYEPILERYIGQYVVTEVLRGEKVEEEYGILKEYSAKYVEILNVRIEVPLHVYLKEKADARQNQIVVEQGEHALRVTNPLARTIVVEALTCGEHTRPLDLPVPGGESAEVALLEGEQDERVTLTFSVRCLGDLIVPRTRAIVRHAGKRERLSLNALLGLDDLAQFPWVKRLLGDRKFDVTGLLERIGRPPPTGS